MRVLLPAGLVSSLARRTKEAWPDEACGMWVGIGAGGDWRVEQHIWSPNLARPARSAFRIDPVVQLRAERLAAGRGWRVLGSWHSHPAGSPHPSAADLALARASELLGIVAVSPEGGTRLQVWRASAAGACEVPWREKEAEGPRVEPVSALNMH
jgi:proteasome lid subunit RPN8/RPN11